MSEFVTAVRAAIARAFGEMRPFLDAMEHAMRERGHDQPLPESVRYLLARFYAETRIFIDLKLPERLRLCPAGALSARRYLWENYRDECGDFIAGADHLSLWVRVCEGVGVDRAAREAEHRRLLPRYAYLRQLEPGLEPMVAELAIMVAWESLGRTLSTIGARILGDPLRARGEPSAGTLEFFAVHRDLDDGHAAHAMRTLVEYATTPALQAVALDAIAATLEPRQYLEAPCG